MDGEINVFTEINEKPLKDKIVEILNDSKPMNISQISLKLNVDKKEVKDVLTSNNNIFTKDLFFNWKLK